jgi:hypothetical protein
MWADVGGRQQTPFSWTARPPLHILQQPIELYHSSVRYHSLNG